MSDKILPFITAMMPKSFKGWILYTLTIAVTVTGAVGYTLMQTEQFQESILKRIDRNNLKARFDEDKFESVAKELMANTGANVVVVWVTDLAGVYANKTVLYAEDKDGMSNVTDGWIGKSSPIYATMQSRLDITHLLEGNVICGRFEVFSGVGKRITEMAGGDYFCSSPVPPTAGHMIGVISAYFENEVEMTKAIQLEMRKAARNIVQD